MRLIDVIAALGLQTLLLMDMSAALAAGIASVQGAWNTYRALASVRQIEHLLDRAVSASSARSTSLGLVVSASASQLVLFTDRDRNGTYDGTADELTAFEVRADDDGAQRLLHRIGRQTMTVGTGLACTARFTYWNRFGESVGTPSAISSFAVPVAGDRLVAAAPAWLTGHGRAR